jgi:hypothetical protein
MKLKERAKQLLSNRQGNVVVSGVMVFITSVILLYVGLVIIGGVVTATPAPTNAVLNTSLNNLTAGTGQGFNLMALSPLVIAATVILGALFAGLFIKSR